jgi:hypothetical protein
MHALLHFSFCLDVMCPYACTIPALFMHYSSLLLSSRACYCIVMNMWLLLQVARWYHGTDMCRHVFIEKHFSTDAFSDDLDSACGTRCDFCRKEVLIHTIIASIIRNNGRCA